MSDLVQPFQTVGILKGGISGEREVSLESGASVEEAIASLGYEVRSFDLKSDEIPKEELQQVEIVFIALHGGEGEGGGIQGQLDAAGIVYTGCDAAVSQLCMDKKSAKAVFLASGINSPRFHDLDDKKRLNSLYGMAEEFGYPLVIKPNSQGSSLGVTIAHDDAAMLSGVRMALRFDAGVLMEEYISGKQLQVGILDDKALPIIEIVPAGEFYDYEAKYQSASTQYLTDITIDSEVYQQTQELALRAHQALGCRDFSRVDLILSADNVLYVLEVNTIPGFTSSSVLAKCASKAGISFPEMIDIILHLAARRLPGQKN